MTRADSLETPRENLPAHKTQIEEMSLPDLGRLARVW